MLQDRKLYYCRNGEINSVRSAGEMKTSFKRYCKTLKLENDPKLIEEYKQLHAMGAAWPEVTEGAKKVGIINLEIYISGTTLFMIMETAADFDHDQAMARLATLPRQNEWEATVSKFQKTSEDASADEKWCLLERIFKMDQEKEEDMHDGYIEEVYY
jgi:L-rhamnose mutarotase